MANHTTNSPIPEGYKRCGRGDNCVHPDGPVLPANLEYFHFSSRDGFSSWCKACDRQKKRAKIKDTPCPICGNPVPARQGKYCSRECYAKDPNRTKGGPMPGIPSWNAGLSAATDERMARASKSKCKNVVDKDTLYHLYVEKGLTLREIGNMYGVSHPTIKRQVLEFNLERIPSPIANLTEEIVRELYLSGMSYADIANQYGCATAAVSKMGRNAGIKGRHIQNRVGIEPNEEVLRKLYWDDWLSYDEIAKRLNVDMSTIPYWFKKLNIPSRSLWETRRGKDWIEPDPQMIIHLYQVERMGTVSIGEIVGTSGKYVSDVLSKHGVPLRKSGYPNIAHYHAKDGHRVKSGLEVQVDNWLFDHNLPHDYESSIGDTQYRSDFLVNDVYIEIWGITGHEKYDEKRRKKTALYQQLCLQLISIYPSDFPGLQILAENFL